MIIESISTEELGDIIAGLVKQGIMFRAFPSNGFWTIELTGGY